jgi:long-chain acyl-CoA synthetase
LAISKSDVESEITMLRLKTLQCLLDQLPEHGSRPALGFRGDYGARWWTYNDLYRNSCRAALSFQQRGLNAGDRVILWSRNCPEWVAHFLGAVLRGLVTVAVHPDTPAQDVADIAASTNARFLLYGSEVEHRTIGLAKQSLFVLDLVPDAHISKLRVSIRSADPALILFTSATSAKARGVMLSHVNIVCQIVVFSRWRTLLKLAPVRLLALSPLSHVQGLMLGACIPLSLGITVLFTASVAPAHVIRLIRTHRIGILSTVPRVLELLEYELRRGDENPSAHRLRTALGIRFFLILVGGATLHRDRELFWRKSLCLLVQGYGSTETSALATLNSPLTGAVGSIGRPLHGNTVHLAEDGEILVRGPHIASEYVANDGTRKLSQNDYLHTGDLGARDHHGRIYFTGRKDSRIVTAEGYNVQPEKLESVLVACSGVHGAVVVSRETRGLEELHAVLLLKPSADSATIIREANRRLSSHEKIGSWSVWPEEDFPRGTLGKIRRDVVASRLTETTEAQALGEETPGSIEECLANPQRTRRIRKLARYLASTVPSISQEAIRKLIQDWGLDSIDAVRLWSELNGGAPARVPHGTDGDFSSRAISGTEFEAPVAPGWQWWPALNWLRIAVRTLALTPIMPFVARVHVTGTQHLDELRPPFVLALDPEDREHAFDYLIVYRALPKSLSRKLLFVVGGRSPGLFDAYLSPSRAESWIYRRFVQFLFYVGLPLLFPYSLFPHQTLSTTLRGLNRTFAWMDRGYNPLLPWGAGTALIAIETQATVLPIRLAGNKQLNHRRGVTSPMVSVSFGKPVKPAANASPEHLARLVFTKLRETPLSNAPHSTG